MRRPSAHHAVSTVDRDGSTLVRAVVVAVPARNEAACVVDCLTSIATAARTCAPVPVHVVVAVDSSTDETAAAAASFHSRSIDLAVVTGDWGTAAGARRAAVDAGRRLVGPDCEPSAVWIANTDADCEVTADWLSAQLRFASRGYRAVGGIVALHPERTPRELLRAFRGAYPVSSTSHEHLHAANLGVRLDVYDRVGGWQARVDLGEEHDLAERLAAHDIDVLRTTASCVTTSERTVGRASGGFADFLHVLASSGAASAPAGSPQIRFVA